MCFNGILTEILSGGIIKENPIDIINRFKKYFLIHQKIEVQK